MSEVAKPHQENKKIKPELHVGLTRAEASQISLDYLESPEVFEALRAFSGKYVDERQTLTEQIDRQFDLLGEVTLNMAAQTKLLDTSKASMPPGSYQSMFPETLEKWARRAHEKATATSTGVPIIMPIALRAAGAALHELHKESQDNSLILASECEGFADTLVEYCRDNIDGHRPITIMGRRYTLWSEPTPSYMESLTKNKSELGKTLVFGNMEQMRVRVKSLKAKQLELKLSERKPVKVGLASMKDWRELLAGLETMTKF